MVICSPVEPPPKFFWNSGEKLMVATPSVLTVAPSNIVPLGSGFSNPVGGVSGSLNIALMVSRFLTTRLFDQLL